MKKIVITGGSSGIGKSLVESFASRGWKVHFTFRSNEGAARELESRFPGAAQAHSLDVTDREACDGFCKKVLGQEGGIDVLVNNAGITRDKALYAMKDEDWTEVLQTNLFGVFFLTRRFALDMMKKKKGRVVNLSSVSGIHGLPGQTNYSASKAGIIGFTKALAKEAGPAGVTANVVAPGGVVTPMIEKLSPEAKASLLQSVPLRRFCEPEEVARVVYFLAEEAPDYLNGSVIVLDGGAG
ncbi:MAG TPA: 3-oxoacyl-ACP reductase FabG, partial [bacterium]|jgi:3-oxoacyl-[acyl-carrier protein] reductase|nr:3-oxoacyl-ACP reductase FabG [bacterium]